MQNNLVRYAVCSALMTGLAACGGGSSDSMSSSPSSTAPPTTQSGTVPMLVSDASSDDWATIGVRVLNIALVPQGGGSNVTVYTAPSAAPYVNLEQLDQLGEILGNVSVPVGTYTGALLTVGGNPGDVMLTAAADPEAGFSLAPGTSVAAADIEIQHTQGSAANLVVPVSVNFVTPLVVSTSQNNAIDLEFDLSHPAFIVGHMPPGAASTQWAVNFTGPVRHRPIADITRLVLRHMYGTVASMASDNSSITITKDFPTLPVQNPEVPVASSQSLSILADATNGTLFYDLDAQTVTTLMNFASETSLAGKYVRIAARYQQDGTLVATRIWASSTFGSVWLSPEGHILHVNAASDSLTIENDAGVGVPMLVNANTQFYFRQPASAIADATAIGSGMSFLASGNLVRGFKVHASAVDPLATPMVAQTIDIETAAYSGTISAANSTGFTYTRNFPHLADDYTVTLDYISASTANGSADGAAITGYKWWNFAYPTLVDSGSTAISDFVSATGGAVAFGGTAPALSAWGVSYATWADPANPTGWSVAASILEPVPVPVVSVASALVAAASDYTFTVTAAGGTQPIIVDVSNGSGEATLVYQLDFSDAVATVSPVDVTTASGLATLTAGLAVGTKVKISGVTQADGTLKAYVITYFTNTTPAS
jgi:Domain of unknown function (DUF4382)/Domain of unknown function (DUF5666)